MEPKKIDPSHAQTSPQGGNLARLIDEHARHANRHFGTFLTG